MDDENQILMRSYTFQIVSVNSVADHNVLSGTYYLQWERKPYCTINKFKA